MAIIYFCIYRRYSTYSTYSTYKIHTVFAVWRAYGQRWRMVSLSFTHSQCTVMFVRAFDCVCCVYLCLVSCWYEHFVYNMRWPIFACIFVWQWIQNREKFFGFLPQRDTKHYMHDLQNEHKHTRSTLNRMIPLFGINRRLADFFPIR